MNEERCGGCEEQEIVTPRTIINRPGLHTLVYRVGTHASFMETMKARLSSSHFSALANLKARNSRDPSIALLDAWATVADVLTFYQERIANEGYLRTAKECRSVLELASLVYYTPGPGVSASVFLALTIEDGYNTEIPTGTRVESLPSSGGLPQPFETFEPLVARADLNTLKPRTTEPQRITLSPPTPPGTTPQPTQPGTPSQPTQPGTPSQPTQPGTPSQPTQPGTTPPTQPGTTPPTQPGTPSQPTQPGTPSQPTQPGTPSQHNREQLLQHNREQLLQHNREQLPQHNREQLPQHNREQLPQHNREQLLQHNREQLLQHNREQLLQHNREQLLQHNREQLPQHNREQLPQHNREQLLQHNREQLLQHNREQLPQHNREQLPQHNREQLPQHHREQLLLHHREQLLLHSHLRDLFLQQMPHKLTRFI